MFDSKVLEVVVGVCTFLVCSCTSTQTHPSQFTTASHSLRYFQRKWRISIFDNIVTAKQNNQVVQTMTKYLYVLPIYQYGFCKNGDIQLAYLGKSPDQLYRTLTDSQNLDTSDFVLFHKKIREWNVHMVE